MAEWARRVAMSERSLARMVRRETGMTFGQWRQQLQIIIALQQLSAGVSVQRTAEILGYESVRLVHRHVPQGARQPPARYVRDSMRRPAD